MGGLFRAPKPVSPPPAAVPPPPPPLPPPPDTPRETERPRGRQGLPSTIATSARGVLTPLPGVARKSLLGE